MELHRQPGETPGAATVLAVDGHDLVAVVRVRDAASGAVEVDVEAPERVGRPEARTLAVTAFGFAARPDGPPRALAVNDGLVRFEARRLGADGPLRGVLGVPGVPGVAVTAAPSSAELPTAGAPASAEVPIADAVGALLPGCDVRTRRSLFRTPDLRVVARDGRGAVRVRLPRDAVLMAEPVAAAADTALAVKERFGRAAAGIDALSFDSGGMALSTGDVSGQAEGGSGVVVLSPNFVGADLLEHERLTRARASRRTRPAPASEPPYLSLDEVVSHECWHYLDAEIRVSGSAYVEFNRALGEALGVGSLELALRGRERDAPPAWQVAHARLVSEVSAYAATSPREATAEMFSRWWCGKGSPVVTRFGELVDQYFPRAA